MDKITLKNSKYTLSISKQTVQILFELSDVLKINELEIDHCYIPEYIDIESMKLILQYCDIYQSFSSIIKPVTEEKFQETLGDSVYDWITSLDKSKLFNILNCVNCLCMDELIEIICIRISLDIKSMDWKELDEYFSYAN